MLILFNRLFNDAFRIKMWKQFYILYPLNEAAKFEILRILDMDSKQESILILIGIVDIEFNQKVTYVIWNFIFRYFVFCSLFYNEWISKNLCTSWNEGWFRHSIRLNGNFSEPKKKYVTYKIKMGKYSYIIYITFGLSKKDLLFLWKNKI